MTIKHEEVKKLLDEFNDLISKSQNIAIYTRDIGLQKEEKDTLKTFMDKAEVIRKSNTKKFTEPELNLILCLIISAEAVQSEISMLVNLKEGDMDAAWSNLISAQNQTSIVASNHPFCNGDYLNGYLARLEAYEKVIFPKMMFASIGGIIRETKCSICKEDYEECDHLKGKMYNGELCVREIHKIDLEEVSIVENPANKLYRVLTTQRNGETVDLLTLKEKILTTRDDK